MNNQSNNIIESLKGIAATLPHNPAALIDDKCSINYLELIDALQQLTEAFKRLDVTLIAFRLDNSIDWALIDLACQAANIISLPLPPFFSQEQCWNCLDSAQASLLIEASNADSLITPSRTAQVQLPLPHLTHATVYRLNSDQSNSANAPLATQKITFTSGSTGAPKGVCLSTEHQWRVAQSLADAIKIDQPRHLCLMPLSTLLENLAGIYTPLLSGGTIYLPSEQKRGISGSSGLNVNQLLTCISLYQPDSMILIPQLLNVLVAAVMQGWQAPTSLKFIAVGGGKVAAPLITQARALGLPVFEGYGLSECGSVVALNTPDKDREGYSGRVLPHCQVTLENGEVVVSNSCHLGYLNEPDSWYPTNVHSGDLAELNIDPASCDQWLNIHGRQKNLLITSFGRNINPEWLEAELMATPLLSHCVIVGDAKPYLVALVSAPENITNEAIGTWIIRVNSKLPDYAQIGNWRRLDTAQWPPLLTANGRPKRQRIPELMADVIESLYQPQSLSNSLN